MKIGEYKLKYIIDVYNAEIAVPDFHTLVYKLKNGILLRDGIKDVLFVNRCCIMIIDLGLSLILGL